MNQIIKEKLITICDDLIKEGISVTNTSSTSRAIGSITRVKTQPLYKWWGKIKSFSHQLGSAGKPWRVMLTTDPKTNSLVFANQILGTLEGIKDELENDYLETFSQLIKSETLGDLLDQAEYLLEKGYFLASGVIGRAVLEEHLRNVCEILNCLPEKEKATLNDYNVALYKFEFYSKTKMKQIDGLISIGNDAAHNKPELNDSDVKRLIRDLPEIIESIKP